MKKIQNFSIDKERGIISWSTNGKEVLLNKNHIDSALIDLKRKIVFILIRSGKFPDELQIYSPEGDKISNFKAPGNFDFYYLSDHPSLGVSIVCVADSPVDNWQDWHFGYDIDKNELFRHCPAR